MLGDRSFLSIIAGKIFPFVAIAAVCLYYSVCSFIFYKNSYIRTYVNKYGIGNRYIFFKWNEISSYKLKVMGYNGFGRKAVFSKPGDAICLGDTSESDFWHQDLKKCVCFELNKKNLEILSKLCEEKNETILDILGWEKIIKNKR